MARGIMSFFTHPLLAFSTSFRLHSSFPLPLSPFLPFLLEVAGPFIQLRGLGECCKLPQRGLGWSPHRTRICWRFEPSKRAWCNKTVLFVHLLGQSFTQRDKKISKVVVSGIFPWLIYESVCLIPTVK